MPEIDVQPFIMQNAVVNLGSTPDDFAAAISQALLAPSSGVANFKGLKRGKTFTYPQAPTWTLTLAYAQDWHSDTSLSRWLFDHQGEVVDCVLDPDDAATSGHGHTQWTMQVAIAPGSVGGNVDAVGTATVQLGVVGEPTPALVTNP